MRRALFWLALVVALGAVVGGGGYAYLGYRATSGPEESVKGYFAALARADAPAALAFGGVPDGPHELLTSAVLAQQQRIAALGDVRVIDVARSGNDARVRFSYVLHFARRPQRVTGVLDVRRRGARWRLASTAVTMAVRVDRARDRVSFAGSRIPSGATLLFPGALPARVDTPYLQFDPATAAARFGGSTTTDIRLQPTATARARLTRSLGTQLAACLAGSTASVTCPLPSPSTRYVPGSLTGRIVAGLGKLSFAVGSDAAGTITMAGTLTFSGSYRELDYENVAHTHTGRLSVPVTASASAVAPLTVRFQSAT